MTKNGSLDGHRMLKNGPNEPTFGPDMYFNVFYWFLKEFLNIFENFPIFGPKMAIFRDFRVLFLIVNFLQKMYLVCGKCSNKSDIWYTHAQRYPLKVIVCRILIFCLKIEFLVILCTSGGNFCHILAHLDHFWAFCGHLKTRFFVIFLYINV